MAVFAENFQKNDVALLLFFALLLGGLVHVVLAGALIVWLIDCSIKSLARRHEAAAAAAAQVVPLTEVRNVDPIAAKRTPEPNRPAQALSQRDNTTESPPLYRP
jgi:hypothetical protein